MNFKLIHKWILVLNLSFGFCLAISGMENEPGEESTKEKVVGLTETEISSLPVGFQLHLTNAKGPERADLLNDISDWILRENPSKGEHWVEKSETLAKALDYKPGMGRAQSNWALIEFRKENYTAAFQHAKQALDLLVDPKSAIFRGICLRRMAHIYAGLGQDDNVRSFFNKAIQYFDGLSELNEKANTQNHFGLFLLRRGNFNEAVSNFKESLGYFNDYGSDRKKAVLYNNLGVAYYNADNPEDALKCYLESLRIREKSGQSDLVVKILVNIGKTQFDMVLVKDAMETFKSALTSARDLKDPDLQAYVLTNLGDCYRKTGNATLAMECYQKSLAMYTQLEDWGGIILNHNGMGLILLEQNRLSAAKEHFQQALELSRKNVIPVREAEALMNLGELAFKEANFNLAISYFKKSIEIYQRFTHIHKIKDVEVLLSQAYESNGQLASAVETLKSAYNHNESLFQRRLAGQVSSLQARFHSERKEKENAILKAENLDHEKALEEQKLTNLAILGIAIFLIFVILILIRAFWMKRKWHKLLSESHDTIVKQKEELEEANLDLQLAMKEVKQLSGLIQICSSCKKIKNPEEKWTSLEEYIDRHTDARFSHGLCPQCAPSFFPESARKDLEAIRQNIQEKTLSAGIVKEKGQ